MVFFNVILDGEDLGEVPCYPNESEPQKTLIVADIFVQVLGAYLRPQMRQQLLASSENQLLVSATLNQLGVVTHIDLAALSIRVSIPIELRDTNQISIGYQRRTSNNSTVLKPDGFSGYVNALVDKKVHAESEGVQGPLPLSATFESVFNFGTGTGNGTGDSAAKSAVVFEDVHNFQEFSETPWRRTESRFVYDDVKNLTRYMLGDVKYPTVGFQTLYNMGGLSASKNYNLDPLSSSTPTSRTSFSLKEASKVDVYLNGSLYRTLQLKPGRYELNELPLGTGANDIDLFIQDKFGATEHLHFPFILASELLRPGLTRYSLSLGYLSEQRGADVFYNSTDLFYSGFYRLGLTDKLTAGLYVQSNQQQWLLGNEYFIGAKEGTYNVDVSASQTPAFAADAAVRLRYRSWQQPLPWLRDWGYGVDSMGRRFTAINQVLPDNQISTAFDIFMSPLLSEIWYTSAGMGYRFNRDPDLDTRNVYVQATRSLPEYFRLSINLAMEDSRSKPSEFRSMVMLNWQDEPGLINQSVSYDSQLDTKRYEFQRAIPRVSGRASDDLNLNADLADNTQDTKTNARFLLNTRRYNLAADFKKVAGKQSEVESSSEGDLSFATGLLFSPKFGVTLAAPVYDSYAVFIKGPGLKNKEIEINRFGIESEARSEGWSTVVLNRLDSYRERSVFLEAEGDENYIDLEKDTYSLRPTYRSGLSDVVDVKTRFLASGILKDREGHLLALKSGSITFLDASANVVPFFTNREGYFEIEHLVPGRYQIRIYGQQSGQQDGQDEEQRGEFLIPAQATGQWNLGELQLERVKQ